MTVEDDRREAVARQQAVVDHQGEGYVQACPGAGKTLTLVRRVERLSSAPAPRKGVAVLSFTNTAVEEFRERCHRQGVLDRLGFPNFIGTFDGFLNHFLVLPFGIEGCASRPVIVDSWNDVEIVPKVHGERVLPVSLKLFDAATGLIDPDKIGHGGTAAIVRKHKAAYEDAAKWRRRALNNKGILCADDARQLVKRFLADRPKADAVGKALAARFSEVIVDEAQDCNADDVAVLKWLKSHGIPLVIVCDPDQAIFEFRKGVSGAFTDFVKDFHSLEMNGNFRSSKTICAAAGSMRARAMDVPVGDHHDAPHPIILIPYGKKATSEIGAKFSEMVAKDGMADCIILAHRRRLAEVAAGAPPQLSGAGGRLARLARLVVTFHTPAASGKQREATLRATIRLLMGIEGWPDDDITSLRPLVESPEVDRAYRRKAVEVLAELPSSHTATGVDGWADRARTLVAGLVALPAGKSIKQVLPSGGDWYEELNVPPPVDVPCATVHEAKGRDYEAVCLVLEKDSAEAVGDWEKRMSSEVLRVLYVGATRAKKMLAIAAPDDLLRRVEAILVAEKIPCSREWLNTDKVKARPHSSKKGDLAPI